MKLQITIKQISYFLWILIGCICSLPFLIFLLISQWIGYKYIVPKLEPKEFTDD